MKYSKLAQQGLGWRWRWQNYPEFTSERDQRKKATQWLQ